VIAQTLLPTADGKGRVAALEILVGVPALRNLIREDKTTQILSVMQVGAQHGMQTLDQALKDLVITGKITRETALERSTNPRLFDGGAPAPAGAPEHTASRAPAASPAASARP
jgi:twitching motility protein PilT